ncbi:MAG: molybdopterin-synthase adenylyltransferase MoeB [Candidatus Palauibacterales bacterium]|nr:molybdopterin-synthase adenylyltransferase MoeB [Candidatus Palauibacterales bacterium]
MARVSIRVPTPLRSLAGGRSETEVRAATVAEALERLTEQHGALRDHLFTEEGELRRFVNVYLGDRSIRNLGEGGVGLSDGDEIRIVPSIAGGAPVASPAAERSGAVDFSPDELRRYSRHLMIPEVGYGGQARLKAARVLLVGAGGLGSPAALYLAAAGVGTLGLVDRDVVDITNLQRQLLHDTDSVGAPKLDSARRRLEALNPEIDVRTFETRLISDNALEVLDGWDLVVDGSDNFPTRYLVNDACVFLGIPFVYGAIYRFEGQASLFGLEDGPCYRCLFPEPPPPGLVPSCADAGVLGVLPGIIGTVQAIEAVKLILGRGRPLSGRLLLFDALGMEFREVEVEKDPDCPVCGEHPTLTELIDYEVFCGLGAGASVDADVPSIGAEQLARWSRGGERYQLIDVREPYEWRICNLESAGARLIPLGELPEKIGELDREATLVLQCRSGSRSADAVRLLRREGFEDVFNLEGGILAWARDVDPSMPTY